MANHPNYQFSLTLPEVFSGQPGEDIGEYLERLENSVRPLAPDEEALYTQLAALLPQRLTGAAYKVYKSFDQEMKEDFPAARERLCAIFHNQDFLRAFRDSLTARPRLAGENIDVYVADLTNLVTQAFPTYNDNQRTAEVLRRFLAGIDPLLRGRCKESNVDNLPDAIALCKNVERAQVDYRAARALTPQYFDTPQDKLPTKTVATINEEPAPQSSTEKLLSTVLSKLNLLEQTMQEQKHQGISDNGSRGRPHDRRRDHYPSRPYDAHRSPTPNYAHRQPPRWRTPDRFYDRSNDRQNFRPRSRNNSPYPRDGSNQRQGFGASRPYYDNRSPSPYHRGNRDRQYSPSPHRGNFRSSQNSRDQYQSRRVSRSPNPENRVRYPRYDSASPRRVTFTLPTEGGNDQ